MHEKNKMIKECIDLRACSYPNWHRTFRKITPKSICIPLPENIIKYLLDEVIILPKECYSRDSTNDTTVTSAAGTSLFDGHDEDTDDTEQPEFPEFSDMITQTIAKLGGAAYIKTNWHSPKDAFWITAGQTMCCKDITDVYQLLKASSICKEDLVCHNLPIFDGKQADCSDESEDNDTEQSESSQYLIFKRWLDIHPGTEFRCFVRNKRIVGISPRDWPQYHEYICAQKVNIVNDILTMFKEHVRDKFPLYDYVFDVVRDAKDSVFLLDFAPFHEKWADSLAFEWPELLSDDDVIDSSEEDDPEFRYLNTDCGIQPSKRNNYGIPMDVIDMFRASNTNSNDASNSSNEQTSPNTLDDVINNRLENIFRAETNQVDSDNES